MSFVDEARIHVKSGDGGNGCVSFRREKYVDMGGPDGGDGGDGGDIVFRANASINTLYYFRHHKYFKAYNGKNGSGSNKHGKSGIDTIIQVPVGTEILDSSGEFLFHDFSVDSEEFVFLYGGTGGIGNAKFKTSVNRAPTHSTSGIHGEEKDLFLRLKLISDVGIIGLPNAGKSMFISRVTNVKPKIADYPFTTIEPNLGVISYFDDELVISDIPGLILGAHYGKGLGTKFLKHIERCRVLIHMIDISGDDIEASYNIIQNELRCYSVLVADKPQIVCLSKTDLVSEDEVLKKIATAKRFSNSVWPISAALSLGMNDIIQHLYILCKQ